MESCSKNCFATPILLLCRPPNTFHWNSLSAFDLELSNAFSSNARRDLFVREYFSALTFCGAARIGNEMEKVSTSFLLFRKSKRLERQAMNFHWGAFYKSLINWLRVLLNIQREQLRFRPIWRWWLWSKNQNWSMQMLEGKSILASHAKQMLMNAIELHCNYLAWPSIIHLLLAGRQSRAISKTISVIMESIFMISIISIDGEVSHAQSDVDSWPHLIVAVSVA